MLNPLVQALDRIIYLVDDPDAGFRFFSETLGLPVAVPPRTARDSTASVIILGNAVVEIIPREARPHIWAGATDPRARLLSVVFRPCQPAMAVPAALRDRAISHIKSRVHRGPIPAGFRPYTNPDLRMAERPLIAVGTLVHGVVQPEDETMHAAVQLLGYTHDVDRRSSDGCAVLRRHNGGPLGLVDAQEVQAEVTELTAGLARWQRFFAPCVPVSAGLWSFPTGPSLRVRAGAANRWHGLLLRVSSLERATNISLRETVRARLPGELPRSRPRRHSTLISSSPTAIGRAVGPAISEMNAGRSPMRRLVLGHSSRDHSANGFMTTIAAEPRTIGRVAPPNIGAMSPLAVLPISRLQARHMQSIDFAAARSWNMFDNETSGARFWVTFLLVGLALVLALNAFARIAG